eukprot:scaffold53456_cov21-Phaeocystis_antarctica.AAC.1
MKVRALQTHPSTESLQHTLQGQLLCFVSMGDNQDTKYLHLKPKRFHLSFPPAIQPAASIGSPPSAAPVASTELAAHA